MSSKLVEAFPDVRIVLVHAGMLTARTQAATNQWRGALAMMATIPDLHVKISGLGMYSSGVTLPQARQVIRDVVQFGVERTVYRQRFPAGKAARELCGLSWRVWCGLVGIHGSRAARRAARQRGEALQIVMLGPRLREDDNHLEKPTAVPCRSYSSARSILTVAISPRVMAFGLRRRQRRRFPVHRPSSGLWRQ